MLIIFDCGNHINLVGGYIVLVKTTFDFAADRLIYILQIYFVLFFVENAIASDYKLNDGRFIYFNYTTSIRMGNNINL